jgi:hypothetical protein
VVTHPDEHREQGAGSRGQDDVGVQQVLMEVGVREHGQPGQHRCHLEVQLIGLRETHTHTHTHTHT